MDEQRQNDQLEPIYNSSVQIQDIVLKTYWERWKIDIRDGRGSERSMLAVRRDDDDEKVQTFRVRGDPGVIVIKRHSLISNLQDWSLTIKCSLMSYAGL